MAQDAIEQPVASTSAVPDMEQVEEPQLSLPLLLDTVVDSYEAQRIHLADACRQIEGIIFDAENLTDLQRDDLRERYTASVENVAARRVFAIGRGRKEGDDRGEVPPGDAGDEATEPPRTPRDADQEGSDPKNLRRRRDDDDDTTRVVSKRARNYDDVHDPHYAWNWGARGGEPPWGSRTGLSTERKTQMLKAVYNFDPKNAVCSLDAQGDCPPFPYPLWRDILCNRHIDFGAIIEDFQSVQAQYDDSVQLGEGEELTVRCGATGKGCRIRTQGDWITAFDRYSEAVLWAYPHRQVELRKYHKHITAKFSSCVDHARVTQYEAAARKYVLQNRHLTLADTHEFVDIAYSHLNPDGSAYQNDKSPRTRTKGGGNKKGGSTPTCGEFNSKKGCTFNPCKFRHVCRGCGGDHPRHRCTVEAQ